MPSNTLPTRLAHPGSWVVAQSRNQRVRIPVVAFTATLTSLRQSGTPRAAAAWLLARLGVALFLLAAAGRVGHVGLLSRMVGQ